MHEFYLLLISHALPLIIIFNIKLFELLNVMFNNIVIEVKENIMNAATYWCHTYIYVSIIIALNIPILRRTNGTFLKIRFNWNVIINYAASDWIVLWGIEWLEALMWGPEPDSFVASWHSFIRKVAHLPKLISWQKIKINNRILCRRFRRCRCHRHHLYLNSVMIFHYVLCVSFCYFTFCYDIFNFLYLFSILGIIFFWTRTGNEKR